MNLLVSLRNRALSLEKLQPPALLTRFAPKPASIVSSVGSVAAAAIAGQIYGLGVRYVTQSVSVVPFHYACWFAVAYQIQELLIATHTLAKLSLLRKPPDGSTRLSDRCRVFLHGTLDIFDRIDQAISGIFGIKPKKAINQENVEQARYLEMCRFRVWKTFKSTLLEIVSFTISYYTITKFNYSLYSNYSVSLYVVAKSIFRESLIVPALHRVVEKNLDKVNAGSIPG